MKKLRRKSFLSQNLWLILLQSKSSRRRLKAKDFPSVWSRECKSISKKRWIKKLKMLLHKLLAWSMMLSQIILISRMKVMSVTDVEFSRSLELDTSARFAKTSISALAVKNLSLMITPSWSWLIPRMLPLWSLLLLMMIKSQLLLIKKREKILNLMVIATCQDISEKTNTGSNSKEVLISGGAMQWIGPIKSVTAWQDQRLRFKLSINLNMSFMVILMKLWWFQLN